MREESLPDDVHYAWYALYCSLPEFLHHWSTGTATTQQLPPAEPVQDAIRRQRGPDCAFSDVGASRGACSLLHLDDDAARIGYLQRPLMRADEWKGLVAESAQLSLLRGE